MYCYNLLEFTGDNFMFKNKNIDEMIYTSMGTLDILVVLR